MTKVLILHRSKSMRNTLRERLEYEGFVIESTDSEAVATKLCTQIEFDLILSDSESHFPPVDTPFIVIDGRGSMEAAVNALRHGAKDYLSHPVDMNRLLQTIHRLLQQEAEQTSSLKTPIVHKILAHRSRPTNLCCSRCKIPSKQCPSQELVGLSQEMEHIKQLIYKVAPCDARVLITGENGTGKEVVAHWIHAKSKRAERPLVEVNCAAIPSELIESELFGHEKGSFTSAIRQRIGKFEQANGGTLFMDEIGDMSLAAQAKVLRALQEKKICRVGSDKDIDIDVRVIAATNKDLRKEIERGNFREDLYHRIGVVIIHIPALREHSTDIPLLVQHFLTALSLQDGLPEKEIDEDAIEELTRLRWSGNIRELRNAIERLMILSEGRITLQDVNLYCKGAHL